MQDFPQLHLSLSYFLVMHLAQWILCEWAGITIAQPSQTIPSLYVHKVLDCFASSADCGATWSTV